MSQSSGPSRRQFITTTAAAAAAGLYGAWHAGPGEPAARPTTSLPAFASPGVRTFSSSSWTDLEVLALLRQPSILERSFELYNLAEDPYETTNLAFGPNQTVASEQVRALMEVILEEQRQLKRLYPASGASQGIPECPVSVGS